jgi:hypothetical protein
MFSRLPLGTILAVLALTPLSRWVLRRLGVSVRLSHVLGVLPGWVNS